MTPTTDVLEDLDVNLSSTTKLVYLTVEEHGPITPTEIAAQIDVDRRTVYGALSTLEGHDLVASKRDLTGDLRKRLYHTDTGTDTS